jgi:hypothetical protein
MNKSITAATITLLSMTGLAWAQGAGQPQTPPPQTPETSATVRPTMTLAGCLYREDQVPGRKPNVAERAGILEDYILADASVAGTQTKPGATPDATGTTGTPATGNMYKVEGPPDEQLKALVGKRVEVTGRISPERGPVGTAGKPRPDQGLGPDAINLPELEATSAREVPGTCPAAPAPRH